MLFQRDAQFRDSLYPAREKYETLGSAGAFLHHMRLSHGTFRESKSRFNAKFAHSATEIKNALPHFGMIRHNSSLEVLCHAAYRVTQIKAMKTTPQTSTPRLAYSPSAYAFVLDSLNHAQSRVNPISPYDQEPHVTGAELLDAFRDLAYRQFGGLALVVLQQWGLKTTNDVGHIVWDLIARGNMRKNDRDKLTDFFDLYDFEEEFLHRYPLNVASAFQDD